MKIKDIRELSTKELEGKITQAKKELFDLRMKQATGNIEKPSKIKELRKDVAKMKTVIRERELEEAHNG